MRATLLAGNPDTTLWFTAACDAASIRLAVLQLPATFVRAAEMAESGDLLVVDCTQGADEDLARYEWVVRHAGPDIWIVYVNDALRERGSEPRMGAIRWVPVHGSWVALVEMLRQARREGHGTGTRVVRKPLTPHQFRVLKLVAEGCAHAMIAARLGKGIGTVKKDIERIKQKLGACTTEELRRAYRGLAGLETLFDDVPTGGREGRAGSWVADLDGQFGPWMAGLDGIQLEQNALR